MCIKNRLTFAISALGVFSLIAALILPVFASDQVIGSARATLSNANAYCAESALGDVVSDGLRQETGAEISLVYSGDLAQYLMSGDLTEADIAAAIPENTPYSLCTLRPAELLSILEHGVGHIALTEAETVDYAASEWDAFPQVSGLELRVDASAPEGQRIMEARLARGVNLTAADSDTAIITVLPTAALSEEQQLRASDSGGIRDLFLGYMAKHGPLEKPAGSRIRIQGAHTNELISSGPVLMIGLIILVCTVMAIPSILRQNKDPNTREDLYLSGFISLRNKRNLRRNVK